MYDLLSEAPDSSAQSPILQTLGSPFLVNLQTILSLEMFFALVPLFCSESNTSDVEAKNVKAPHCPAGHNGTLRNLNGRQNSIWNMDLDPASMKRGKTFWRSKDFF